MSIKKHKPLGSAMEEFVFGIKEPVPAPTATELVSPAPIPTASLITETPPTPPTPFALLPTETPPGPKASAPHLVTTQSKEPSLMSKLQAPGKEATVRFSVDIQLIPGL
ncbi:hypothetical protein [Microcoleus sp. herbarium2]|uniref:hypothetical protein n=1 Tax=Microcoleus sp. herbarium2 TaxID=3055433 RepID=UPI002FD564CB